MAAHVRTLPLGLALLIVSSFFTGCASLPPARSVTSDSDVAGKWEGTGRGPGGSVGVTQTINRDGTYTSVLPNGTFTGKITLVDGKLRGKSDQTGRTGIYTLHEGEGKRILKFTSDDGALTSELRPAK